MTTLAKSTRIRLIKDIKETMNYSENNKNIFYKHSEEDLLTGYALIIGDEDSPYRYGNYMFRFTFPEDYPFSPPKVKYLTNDGIIRYHPNLYKNGTCCLSILNTWKGDQWTACQTILSVLLSISSIFQINSLTLEPGVRMYHPDVEKYNRIIEYKNVDFAVHDIVNMSLQITDDVVDKSILEGGLLSHCIRLFKDEILDSFKKNVKQIMKFLEENKHMNQSKQSTSMYHMNVILSYSLLEDKVTNLQSNFK